MRKGIHVVLGLTVCMALVFHVGCSKKEDSKPSDTGGKPAKSNEQQGKSSESERMLAEPRANAVQRTATPKEQAGPDKSTTATKATSPSEIAQMLKSSGDREAAFAAIKEYARKNPASLAEMSSYLRSGDADFAVLGEQGLVGLATPEALTELLAAIQSTQAGPVRRQLVGALSDFNSPQAAELLLGLLGSSGDREMVSAAQRALGNSASDALLSDVVKRYQASNSATERDNLIAAIRQMHNSQVVDGLLGILNEQKVVSSTEPLGLAVADTLGIIGTPSAVSNLFLHLSSLREGASSPVYDSIGRVSNPEALSTITSMAYGQVAGASLYSRMAAVQAMGNYSSNVVFPALNWIIQNDPNAGLREAAGTALQKCGRAMTTP